MQQISQCPTIDPILRKGEDKQNSDPNRRQDELVPKSPHFSLGCQSAFGDNGSSPLVPSTAALSDERLAIAMQIRPDFQSEILLEVKNLTVMLDRSPIVHDLSFSVADGEFLTILGPNGSGKSVLVKALIGLLPYSGDLIWYRKPKIGYLPQGLNQMFVRDMPLSVKDFFALKKLRPADVLTYLSVVGLEESVLKKRAGNLSGGEFQRMLVAWVLASEPNVLFLDEPTTAVDIAGGETIYSLLNVIWRKRKLTIFNVTHDLNIVFAHSTHVLCLSRRGHLCYGVPREVLTPGVLSDVYGAEIKFHTH
jgi:zinc transport system ATP-binding protein